MRAIALVILTLSVPTYAQTVSEVERRYGKPIYSVSEHIWMTPDYSADGQVCRMRLYPKRFGEKTDNLISQLMFPELTELLNEIVPPGLRGSKQNGFGQTSLGGGTAWTTYAYENMTLTFNFSYKLDPNVLKIAEGKGLTGPASEGVPVRKNTPPSLDDFYASQNSHAESVTINWNHRPCPAK
jgi:hypothetical protein